MGNRHSRSKSTSDAIDGSGSERKSKRKKRSRSVDDTQSRASYPDSTGGAAGVELRARPPRDERRTSDLRLTIYRSDRDLGRKKPPNFTDGSERVAYTLHRKTSARYPSMEKPQTLPRNFGRSKSTSFPNRHALTPNGNVPQFPTLPEQESTGILRHERSSSTRSAKGRPRTSSAASTIRACKYAYQASV